MVDEGGRARLDADPATARGVPRARTIALLVALLFGALLALGARLGPATSTETRYAAAGREMAASGDWVVPTLNRGPLLEKPPLVYWGEAASFLAFGVGDVAARLPVLAAALAILLLVGWAARRLAPEGPAAGRSRGRLATLALATSPSFLVLAYVISHDVWLVLAATAAGVALFECVRAPERPRLRWVLALHASLGAGMLAKGPVVLVLVVVPGLLVAAVRRTRRPLWALGHPLGLLVFAAVAVPWYLAADARIPGLLRTLVDRRLTGALSGNAEFHQNSPFVLALAIVGTLPWLGALPAAIRTLLRRGGSQRTIGVLGVLLAVASPLLFVFSASVLPSYSVPAVPWLLLLVALGAPAPGEDARAWTRGLAVGTGLFGVGFGAAVLATVWRREPPLAVSIAAVALAAAGTAFALARRFPPRWGPVGRAAGVSALVFASSLVLAGGAPAIARAENPLWEPVAAMRKPDEALGAWLRPNDSWGFLPWRSREDVVFFGYPSKIVVVPPEAHSPGTYRPRSELDAWMRSDERRWLMLRVKDHRKLKMPVWVAARGPKYEIVTNQPIVATTEPAGEGAAARDP